MTSLILSALLFCTFIMFSALVGLFIADWLDEHKGGKDGRMD